MIKRKKLWMAGGDGEEKEREALVWENGAGEGLENKRGGKNGGKLVFNPNF
jgi:hypothetical protein